MIDVAISTNYDGPGARLFLKMKAIQKYAKPGEFEILEILEFRNLVYELMQILKKDHSRVNFSLKVHLLYHVPQFLETHGFWGSGGEQSTESIHHQITMWENRCVKKKVKLNFPFEEQILRNRYFIS